LVEQNIFQFVDFKLKSCKKVFIIIYFHVIAGLSFNNIYYLQLEDIPIRLLERILVKTVVTEVRSMKLAKSVWEEKAVLVISRLTTVCLLWSSILTTNRFLTEVHRILDGIG